MYPKTRGGDRIQTFLALEEIGAEDLDVFLRDALNDPEDNVRYWAAQRLAAQSAPQPSTLRRALLAQTRTDADTLRRQPDGAAARTSLHTRPL